MFIGTVQAQDPIITTKVSVEEITEICVFKISGQGENMAGMMCSGCTSRVETALLKVDGIISVDAVDYGAGTATVTIAKESQAKELIPAAIEKVNFVATLIEDGEEVEKAVDD